MSSLAPPPSPPRVNSGDGDGSRQFRIRSTQVFVTLATLITTAYFCSFGPIPAIIALSFAKHILVSVLMMGLGTYDRDFR